MVILLKPIIKLGVNCWMSKTHVTEDIVQFCRRADFGAIEIAGFPREYSSTRRSRLKRVTRELEIQIATVSTAVPMLQRSEFNLHSTDPDERNLSIRYVEDCIDLAVQIGAGLVYVCSIRQGQSAAHEQALVAFKESLCRCSDYAAEHGVRLALEHVPTGELPTVAETVSFLKGAGSKDLGILLDLGHLNLSKEDLRKSVEDAKPLLAHVHINNNDGVTDTHLPPFQGTIDRSEILRFITLVLQAGYSGSFGIEMLNVIDPVSVMAQSKEFIEDLMVS